MFIDFRLIVILLLVVRGREGFLPMLPPWLEEPNVLLHHVNFRISIPSKTLGGILIGIALNLYISLKLTDVFIVLRILIHDHGVCF